MEISRALALHIFIATGFDYRNMHNPEIVCDKDSVMLAFTPHPAHSSNVKWTILGQLLKINLRQLYFKKINFSKIDLR